MGATNGAKGDQMTATFTIKNPTPDPLETIRVSFRASQIEELRNMATAINVDLQEAIRQAVAFSLRSREGKAASRAKA